MPTDEREDLLELVANEWYWRLSKDKCSECGRGDEAHELGATALSQVLIGLQRLEIAKQKAEETVREESQVNPFSLLVTAGKLPAGNESREAILDRVEGEAIALSQAVRKMREE